jgi:hypothetical protein
MTEQRHDGSVACRAHRSRHRHDRCGAGLRSAPHLRRAPSALARFRRERQERESFEQEASLLRRAVLAVDIIVFAGIGYWLGAMMAD